MIAYVSCGTTAEKILAISSIRTTSTTISVELDDTAIDFAKLEGYTMYTDESGANHLKFDTDKYDAYLEQIAKQEAEQKALEEQQKTQTDILNMFKIEYQDSDKDGYQFKVYMLGDVVIKKEYVEAETDSSTDDGNDGSDYTKPITYKEGMSVTKGLWYTDGDNIWECILDGTPTSFSDKEYFDIIE